MVTSSKFASSNQLVPVSAKSRFSSKCALITGLGFLLITAINADAASASASNTPSGKTTSATIGGTTSGSLSQAEVLKIRCHPSRAGHFEEIYAVATAPMTLTQVVHYSYDRGAIDVNNLKDAAATVVSKSGKPDALAFSLGHVGHTTYTLILPKDAFNALVNLTAEEVRNLKGDAGNMRAQLIEQEESLTKTSYTCAPWIQ